MASDVSLLVLAGSLPDDAAIEANRSRTPNVGVLLSRLDRERPGRELASRRDNQRPLGGEAQTTQDERLDRKRRREEAIQIQDIVFRRSDAVAERLEGEALGR